MHIITVAVRMVVNLVTSAFIDTDDDDVYLDKLQIRGVKKSIIYM
jgi:hypothetical protein